MLLAALILGACGGDTTLDSQGSYFAPTAAVVCGAVNCQKIPESRVNARLSGAVEHPATAAFFQGAQGTDNRLDAQREILSGLILREIALQMARTMRITVDDSEIERRLQAVKDGFPSEEAFRNALQEDRISENELRDQLASDLVITQVRDVVGRDAEASPLEVERFYELNRSQYDEQVRVAHIVVCGNFDEENRSCEVNPADQQRATDIASRARDGEDFGALAREFSVDAFSRERDGELDFISRGDVVPALEEAAFGLFQPGDIAEPVQTEFGFHVVKLLEVGRPFEDARAEIAQSLANQRANAAFEEWMIDAVKQAQIKVNPKLGVYDEISQSVVAQSALPAGREG